MNCVRIQKNANWIFIAGTVTKKMSNKKSKAMHNWKNACPCSLSSLMPILDGDDTISRARWSLKVSFLTMIIHPKKDRLRENLISMIINGTASIVNLELLFTIQLKRPPNVQIQNWCGFIKMEDSWELRVRAHLIGSATQPITPKTAFSTLGETLREMRQNLKNTTLKSLASARWLLLILVVTI